MVQNNRIFAVSAIMAAGFLSACAAPNESTITRAWQVDYAIDVEERECRFDMMSQSVADEIETRIDADQVFEELWQACPELALVADPEGRGTDGPSGADSESFTVASADGGTEAPDAESGAESGPAGDGAGDSSDGADGGSDAGSDGGSDSGSDSGSDGGSDGGSDSDSGGRERGSNANNGGGNGSEGSSPGRGKGANEDE